MPCAVFEAMAEPLASHTVYLRVKTHWDLAPTFLEGG